MQNGKQFLIAWFSGKQVSYFLFVLVLILSPSLQAQSDIQLTQIGTYTTGVYDEGAAEIVVFDALSQRVFVINANAATVDVLDLSNPHTPALLFSIDVSPYGAVANSVATYNGTVAVAVENNNKQAPGKVVFYDLDGNYLNDLTVGSLPDMVTFTPDGKYLLVANEGEPDDDYLLDPEGSVSIIKMKKKVQNIQQAQVKTADFQAFNNNCAPGVRISGPNATVAQDLEPEYIAVGARSKQAWVTLQENNALAKIKIKTAEVKKLIPLGYKDHNAPGNGLDPSNRDAGIQIANWPVRGLYMPDAIAAFEFCGQNFFALANEGDSRDYGGTPGFVDEERIEDVVLDPTCFPNAADLQDDENLGRLKIVITEGDVDGDGDFDELYSYGARSFSIRNARGNLIYDSGDDFEQITAMLFPDDFNSDNGENDSFDNRSDDKGPEPEGIAVGEYMGHTYAFIGLERIGGIMVYDITDPYAPAFVTYVNNRDFAGDAELGTAGDLGPEGIAFVPASQSPTCNPLLVVGNEVSGSTTVYEITPAMVPGANARRASLPTEGQVALLSQNYPNPFYDRTEIAFEVATDQASVALSVHDLSGRKLRTLAEGPFAAGRHQLTWMGNDDQGNMLPAGTYLYIMRTAGLTQARKMVILR